MSDDEKQKKGKAKGSKGKAGKGKSKGKSAADSGGISLSTHPQASLAISTLKAWGGLIGFGLAAYLSLQAGVPLGQVGMRAIIAGVAGYMVAWACGVAAWRAIVTAEARAQLERRAAEVAQRKTAKT